MRIDSGKIYLSKVEADLFSKTSQAVLEAIGCLAVNRAIQEAEANAKVNIILDLFKRNGVTPDLIEIALEELFLEDKYISIPDGDETRYTLEQVYRYQLVDDVEEGSPDFLIRESERRIADAAVDVLS